MFKLAEWLPAGPGIIGIACPRIHTGSAPVLTMQYDRCIVSSNTNITYLLLCFE